MARRRRVHALAAVAVGVSVLVAGCTQDAGPKPSPLPSPTKTSSASAPTPPVMPAAAKGASAESAKAFARYYVDLVNFSSISGDTDALRALGTAKCSTCRVIANEIERPYREGGHLEGGSWRPGTASVGMATDNTNALVSFPVRITAQTEFSKSDAAEKTSPAATGSLDLRLVRRSGTWLVDRLDARQS